MRIFSYGGGVQSTAVLVLVAQGVLEYDALVFSNVGDDSENPGTLRYYREIAVPYAEKHDVNMVEVHKTRYGEPETLLERIYRNNKSTPLPMKLRTGAYARRACTVDFKINVIDRWANTQGVTRLRVGIGFSTDEWHRMKRHEDKWDDTAYVKLKRKKEYPLVDMGFSRTKCRNIIKEANLPIAPKSSCWFCPARKHTEWLEMKADNPDLFAKAVDVERFLQSKRPQDELWLHTSRKPLDVAVGLQENFFDEFDNCEEGYCMT